MTSVIRVDARRIRLGFAVPSLVDWRRLRLGQRLDAAQRFAVSFEVETVRACRLEIEAAAHQAENELRTSPQRCIGVRRGSRSNAHILAAGFDQQPQVANGAPDLFVEVFGDAGRHARTAVGVNELPAGFAVEVELVVEVDGAA